MGNVRVAGIMGYFIFPTRMSCPEAVGFGWTYSIYLKMQELLVRQRGHAEAKLTSAR
jgi:hypothetical protein